MEGQGGLPGRLHRGLHRLRRHLGPGLVSPQSGKHGIVDGGKYCPLLAEFDLLLGGVDIHIHRVELHLEVEHAAGKPAHHLLVGVSLLQGGGHRRAFHIAAIDKEKLIASISPAAGGQGDKAGDADIVAGGRHRGKAQGQVPAKHGVHGRAKLPVARGEQLLLAVPDKLKGDLRVGHGLPLHRGKTGRPLGGILFHKLQPGGGIKKEVADEHGGALGAARLLLAQYLAPFNEQGGAQGILPPAGKHLHPGYGGDGGQSLPPEAQGADGLQVVLGAYLGCGVAEEGGGKLIRGNAAAVVGDTDKAHAAVLYFHRHHVRSGVHRILHQLLHYAGGTLHHLAGGNEVGHMGG